MRASLEGLASSPSDLLPLAILVAEWHPPTRALRLQHMPVQQGGQPSDAFVAVMPAALPPVAASVGVAHAVAHTLVAACDSGDVSVAALTRASAASLAEVLGDGDVSERLRIAASDTMPFNQ